MDRHSSPKKPPLANHLVRRLWLVGLFVVLPPCGVWFAVRGLEMAFIPAVLGTLIVTLTIGFSLKWGLGFLRKRQP